MNKEIKETNEVYIDENSKEESFLESKNTKLNEKAIKFLQKFKWVVKLLIKIKNFFVKYKKIIIPIAIAIVVAITTITVLNSIKANEIKSNLNNKIFIEKYKDNYGTSYYIYNFEDNKVSVEWWTIKGWIDEEKEEKNRISNRGTNEKFRVRASIFSDQAEIEYKWGKNWTSIATVTVDSSNKVPDQEIKKYSRTYNWYETTIESVELNRKDYFCSHNWVDKEVIIKATCAKSGETLQSCTKCGFEEIKTVFVEHNYDGNTCTACGEKLKAHDIEADTWYYSKSVNALRFQNIKLDSVYPIKNYVSVTYHPVCKHCHVISDSFEWSSPSINAPVWEMYTCAECNKITIIQLKIQN